MDAYVLGSHSGELPTHLVSANTGNRIRAVARLEGGQHDIFYALEVDSVDDFDRHVRDIEGAGTRIAVVLNPHGGNVQMGPIPLPIPPPPPTPSWIPPCEWAMFVFATVEDIVGLIEKLRERFGVEYVAGLRVGNQYILEVGAEERDSLETALAGLSPADAHFANGVHRG